ncbi:hypothetical protein LTR15_012341 [Elasticomyces elasticus]|nr:hypothetical protein LTR15_012341 [Elasticomyces elasticus]
MPKQQTLGEQIASAIKPWQRDHGEPLFSDRDLLVLALASLGQPSTTREACKWIFQKFPYYREVTFLMCWDAEEHGCNGYMGEFKVALNTFDTAFNVVGRGDDVKYTVSTAAIYEVLNGLSTGPSHGECLFFKLPAELRNTIYEMVFSYPRSGLRCPRDGPYEGFGLLTLDMHAMADQADRWDESDSHLPQYFHDPGDLGLRTASVQELLSPLLTCRQFFHEAMPVFYQINSFHFSSCSVLDSQLSALTLSRRKHIHHVSARATYEDDPKAIRSAFKQLAKMETLRTLNLRLDEETWLSRSKHGQIKKYAQVTSYPGLAQLRNARGLHQVMLRGAPKIEALIKFDMLSPKTGKSPKRTTGRQRKASGRTENSTQKDDQVKR